MELAGSTDMGSRAEETGELKEMKLPIIWGMEERCEHSSQNMDWPACNILKTAACS
jgi:hypothetical protein